MQAVATYSKSSIDSRSTTSTSLPQQFMPKKIPIKKALKTIFWQRLVNKMDNKWEKHSHGGCHTPEIREQPGKRGR